jgi:hypothetical protein
MNVIDIVIVLLSVQLLILKLWWGNLRERDKWGDPGVDGRIILKWMFRKWDVKEWTGLTWLRIRTDGGHL